MPYFADLTVYTFLPSEAEPKAYNVGWLDPTQEFERWIAPERFVSALLRLTNTARVHQTRGWHVCAFCLATGQPGTEETRGSYEIRVVAEDGEVFLAPSLVHHYVAAHGNRPPVVFVNAVLFQARHEID